MRFMLHCLIAAVSLGFTATVEADDVIFNFESPDAASAWQIRAGDVNVQSTSRFASDGEQALELTFPAYREDGPSKRSVEAFSPLANWTPYKWLVTDITNPTEHDITMHAQLYAGDNDASSDSKFLRFIVPAMTTRRTVHGLNFGGHEYAKNISKIRFYVEDETEYPSTLIVDNLTLVSDSQKPDDQPLPAMQTQMDAALHQATQTNITQARQTLDQTDLPSPLAQAVRKEIRRIHSMLKTSEDADPKKKMQTYWGSLYLQPMIERMLGLTQYADAYDRLHKPNTGYLVGFATSMKKVMPRHLPVHLDIARGITLTAAKDERESFQLVVAPLQQPLGNVTVTASDLRGADGLSIPASAIDCDLVAYTQTTEKPGYKVDYVGWWPDPIIADPKPIDIALGEVQPWWIRVHVPKDQAAGGYTGKITINAAGSAPAEFDLEVQVHDFAVPPHTPLPTAISTLHNKAKNFIEKSYIGGWDRWNEKLKFEHADFLADYYITLDSIYRHTDDASALDMQVIEYLDKQGRLGPFSIGYYFSDRPEKLEHFRENYEAVKQADLVDHAYLYGYDEQGKWSFPKISAASKWFEQNYPGVLTLTTAGVPADLPHLQGHIPIIAGYSRSVAEKAERKYGKKFWWYTCVWPPHPYPNVFIEYEPMDIRALMGVMTAYNNADGFLYYSTTWFNDNTGIDAYPYTTWNPVTFPHSHGDGRWLYIDTQGNLISSMVLENYRDGLEDLAYHMILQHKLNLYNQQHNGWLRLVRQGGALTGYRSGDGKRWEKIETVRIHLDDDVYIGLASAAHARDIPGSVTFADIDVRGRGDASWQSQDIGNVDGPGETVFDTDAKQVTLKDQGRNIWGADDAMHFAYRRLSGNGAITVRVADLKDADDWAKAGVMIRENLDPKAANAFVALTPGHGTIMQTRRSANARTDSKVFPHESEWARQARQALDDVDQLAYGRIHYNENPQALNAYRRRLAELIDASPIEDDNPWPDGIPARGVDVYPP